MYVFPPTSRPRTASSSGLFEIDKLSNTSVFIIISFPQSYPTVEKLMSHKKYLGQDVDKNLGVPLACF